VLTGARGAVTFTVLAVRALALSGAFLAVGATVLPLSAHPAADALWVVACVVAVIWTARRWGPAVAVPLAIAAGLAIDMFIVPPVVVPAFDDVQAWFGPAVYLMFGTLAGVIATRAQDEAVSAEAERGVLADEQAALRRVATLVATDTSADEVFDAIVAEVGLLLDLDAVRLVRSEGGRGETMQLRVAAGWNATPPATGRGAVVRPSAVSVAREVLETGRPARRDDPSAPPDAWGFTVGTVVGVPVTVDGATWGALLCATRRGRVPPADTEDRVAEFTGLAATAISDVEARQALASSRARLVEASDAVRRRIVRDLHDGAQQRLVHTVMMLKLACRASAQGEDAAPMVDTALEHAQQATRELRDLVYGILPTALTRGGLRAAVDELAAPLPFPVHRSVVSGRLPASVESTAYFVVAEALTNAVKHAAASAVEVRAVVEGGELVVEISDDGIGGARPDGAGLVGLSDRVWAQGGRLVVHSAPNAGTRLRATVPLDPSATAQRCAQ
jgi:signal transduction histidine kinase